MPKHAHLKKRVKDTRVIPFMCDAQISKFAGLELGKFIDKVVSGRLRLRGEVR